MALLFDFKHAGCLEQTREVEALHGLLAVFAVFVFLALLLLSGHLLARFGYGDGSLCLGELCFFAFALRTGHEFAALGAGKEGAERRVGIGRRTEIAFGLLHGLFGSGLGGLGRGLGCRLLLVGLRCGSFCLDGRSGRGCGFGVVALFKFFL